MNTMPSTGLWADTLKPLKPSYATEGQHLIGLEVELEGKLTPIESLVWGVHNESSLRPRPNAYEYVFNKPLNIDEALLAIKTLATAAENWEVKPSVRCSTHMHFNVLGQTHLSIMSALCLYLLFEEVLVSLQSNNRIGNLHCLRASDSESIPVALVNLSKDREKNRFPKGNPWTQFPKDAWKYGAVNLYTIANYGSLEYRFFDPMWKKDQLIPWVTAMYNMHRYGIGTGIDVWLKEYNDLPVFDFIKKVFKEHASWIIGGRSRHELNSMMHTNYSYINDIIHGLSKNKLTIPWQYLHEFNDLSPEGDDDSPFDSAPGEEPPGYSLEDKYLEYMKWYVKNLGTGSDALGFEDWKKTAALNGILKPKKVYTTGPKPGKIYPSTGFKPGKIYTDATTTPQWSWTSIKQANTPNEPQPEEE